MIPNDAMRLIFIELTSFLSGGGEVWVFEDPTGCFLAKRESETGGFPICLRLRGSLGSKFWLDTTTFAGGVGMLPADEAEPLRCSDRLRC